MKIEIGQRWLWIWEGLAANSKLITEIVPLERMKIVKIISSTFLIRKGIYNMDYLE